MTSYFGMLPPLTFGARSGGEPPFNAVIDFTAATLDPRVSYTGPAHSYIGADGAIKQSAANAWPLEYVDGVVAGRHEPEKASTNYMPSTNFESLGGVGSNKDWIYAGTVTSEDSTLGVKALLAGATSVLTGVYSEATGNFIAAAEAGPTPAKWTLIKRTFNNARAAVLRWYPARLDSTVYLYGRTASVPVGDMVASVMRMVTANNVQSAITQVEPGSIVTSPIINGEGVSGSRAAASAVINEPLATGATVTFSDGTTTTLTASSGKIAIPIATLDWRKRFIKQIELTR